MRLKLTPDKRRELRSTGEASIVGWVLAISVVIGTVVGSWVDSVRHSAPTGVTIGLVVGAAAGFLNLFKVALRIMREEDEEDRRKRGGR